MKILAVSDVESPYYYDHYQSGMLDGIDLILSCGDLRKEYLEFLFTMAHCPLLYVRGDHDDDYAQNPPEGCICVEDQIYTWHGLRILGLGGSFRYQEGRNMYTEEQMRSRVQHLQFLIWQHRGFDILLAHAPAGHIHDFDSLAHRGFECFKQLIDRYKPPYFIHGHVHQNDGVHIPQISKRGYTTIINVYNDYRFDYVGELLRQPSDIPRKYSIHL